MFGVMLMVYRIAPQRQPPVSFSGRSEVAMMILLYAIDFERVRVEYQAIYIPVGENRRGDYTPLLCPAIHL